MTDTLTGMLSEEEFLEQSGVKGMKWGVIRDKAAAGDRHAQKKLDKADAKWEASSHGTAAFIAVHNKVADKMNNGGIEKFNANPKYKKIKDFSDESDPKVQEYYNDYQKLTAKVFAETVKETYGTSPSGRYSAEVSHDKQGNYYAEMVDSQAVTHADAPPRLIFALTFDPAKGFTKMGDKPLPPDTITHSIQKGSFMSDDNKDTDTLALGMMTEEQFLEHTGLTLDMDSDDVLAHFGKKGMKWGVRKDGTAPDGRQAGTKQELKALDKASKAKDKSAHDSAIDAARGRIADGTNRANYKAAKTQYKSDKLVIGKREAKKAFQAVKDKNVEDYNKSKEAKSGRETVVATVGAVAGVLLLAAASSH